MKHPCAVQTEGKTDEMKAVSSLNLDTCVFSTLN